MDAVATFAPWGPVCPTAVAACLFATLVCAPPAPRAHWRQVTGAGLCGRRGATKVRKLTQGGET